MGNLHHGQYDNPWQIQRGNNFYSQRGLARTRAASNADDASVGPRRRIVSNLHLRRKK